MTSTVTVLQCYPLFHIVALLGHKDGGLSRWKLLPATHWNGIQRIETKRTFGWGPAHVAVDEENKYITALVLNESHCTNVLLYTCARKSHFHLFVCFLHVFKISKWLIQFPLLFQFVYHSFNTPDKIRRTGIRVCL